MDHKDDKPITLVVRRGALRRYDKLKRETANLPVVVTWDRRRSDRDATDTAPPAVERRRQMSFTWEMADFVVVPGNEATEADSQPSEAAAPESQATPATDADLPTRKSS